MEKNLCKYFSPSLIQKEKQSHALAQKRAFQYACGAGIAVTFAPAAFGLLRHKKEWTALKTVVAILLPTSAALFGAYLFVTVSQAFDIAFQKTLQREYTKRQTFVNKIYASYTKDKTATLSLDSFCDEYNNNMGFQTFFTQWWDINQPCFNNYTLLASKYKSELNNLNQTECVRERYINDNITYQYLNNSETYIPLLPIPKCSVASDLFASNLNSVEKTVRQAKKEWMKRDRSQRCGIEIL